MSRQFCTKHPHKSIFQSTRLENQVDYDHHHLHRVTSHRPDLCCIGLLHIYYFQHHHPMIIMHTGRGDCFDVNLSFHVVRALWILWIPYLGFLVIQHNTAYSSAEVVDIIYTHETPFQEYYIQQKWYNRNIVGSRVDYNVISQFPTLGTGTSMTQCCVR
jgi:hypothetical protein